MAVSQERITVYNLSGNSPPKQLYSKLYKVHTQLTPLPADLKNTSDDSIPNYLNSLKFRQSHTLTDVRLTLGFSAFALAAACFLWDYKFGFESTKVYTALAVALYTLINGLLTVWIFAVEKGTIYVGTSPSGETVKISTSSSKKHPTEYVLTVEVTSKKGGKEESFVLKRSFTDWFDEAGHFVVQPFQEMLARGIPAVGKLDPRRAAIEEVETVKSEYTAEMLEALTSAQTVSGADAGEKKGAAGKRRKA